MYYWLHVLYQIRDFSLIDLSFQKKKPIEIPSFKASVGTINWQVPATLKLIGKKHIRKIQNVNKEIAIEFVNILKENNRPAKIIDEKKLFYEGETYEGRKAHKKYLISQIYSLAIPTLINFSLLSQQNTEEMLTFFGRKLLTELEINHTNTLYDNANVFNLFKNIILYNDLKNIGIINSLNSIKKGSLTELINEIENRGIVINVSQEQIWYKYKKNILTKYQNEGKIKSWRDSQNIINSLEKNKDKLLYNKINRAKINKIRNLLNLYINYEIILQENKEIKLNLELIERYNGHNYWKKHGDVDPKKFFNSLSATYQKINTNNKYIPIPIIRSLVCQDLNFPWDAFDKHLINLGYEYNGTRIALIPPVTTKIWGINRGRKHYYYILVD